MVYEKKIEELLIFKRMAEGDKEAFRFFFDRYYSDLCNFVNLYLRDPLVAEDIVQDIFVYFWDKRSKISLETSVKAYLFIASKNKSLNHLRNVRRKHIFQEQYKNSDIKVVEISDEQIDAAQIRQVMHHAVEQLPARVRQVFLLGKEQKMTYGQIAEELGISEKTVENQMGLALKKIRLELRPFYNKIFTLFMLNFFA